MKYSVEEILSNGAAVLVSDDGKKLTAERGRFDSEPVEGMLCELIDGIFHRDEAVESGRREEAAALLDELLGK